MYPGRRRHHDINDPRLNHYHPRWYKYHTRLNYHYHCPYHYHTCHDNPCPYDYVYDIHDTRW